MNKDVRSYLIIIAVSAILFIPFLGRVHLFDWDEINFAECSREMIETGDYLRVYIDYEPFWEKPPLFFWVQAASMHVFGINEFAARFPNALIGIITLLTLFYFGKKFRSERFAWYWVLAYAGSILPYFYFRSGILDPLFNYFMFMSVLFFYQAYTGEYKRKHIIIAGVMIGLAVLVKGPVGYLVPTLTYGIFVIPNKLKNWKQNRLPIAPETFKPTSRYSFPIIDFFIYSFTALGVASIWFGLELAFNGTWFLEEFIRYQIRLFTTGDAGHSGPFYYHTVILLIGCFPASFFFFQSFRKRSSETGSERALFLWMIILLCVVVILFSIVKTKIVHYSSLSYYPITFIAALGMERLHSKEIRWQTWKSILLGFFGFITAGLFFILVYIGMFKDSIIPLIKDKFVLGNLSADVRWEGFEIFISILFFAVFAAGVFLLWKGKFRNGFIVVYGSIAMLLSLYLPFVLPKIETYVQGAPVTFYESTVGKDVYVKAIGFRSYADLFYTKKPKNLSASGVGVKHSEWEKWLLEGPIDKPAYFVTKNKEAHQWIGKPGIELIEEKNGFVFFKRVPR